MDIRPLYLMSPWQRCWRQWGARGEEVEDHTTESAHSSLQVSGVRCQVSGVRCQVSGVRWQVSGVRCQVSGVRCQVSGVTWTGKYPSLEFLALFFLDISLFLSNLVKSLTSSPEVVFSKREIMREDWRDNNENGEGCG